jgi:hypothetical protein
MKKLESLLSNLESKIPQHEVVNPAVSRASVGWHIEHSLLTLNQVMDTLTKSNPEEYKKKFDYRRVIVMWLGKFPRGRIQSPKAVRPTVDFNEETLRQHLRITREKMKSLFDLPANHYFTHPFLGDFKLRPAIKFLGIHTRHHLSIMDDILSKEVASRSEN